jgi:serine phosphatase RsbU (regulator of sigma subunit)
LFDPRRADELAEMMAQALDNTALRQEAFNNNRRLVDQQANMRKNMEHLSDIFAKLIAGQLKYAVNI